MKQTTLSILLSLAVIFGFSATAHAATYSRTSQLVGSSLTKPVALFDGKFKGGASIVAADTDGDGVDEYIVGAGPGGGPLVQVLAADGSLLQSWMAYPTTFRGGVNVAAGDLNGDGHAEVVTVPQGDAEAIVNIFRDGKKIASFPTFDRRYHEGANVAVLEQYGIQPPSVVIATHGLRKNEVRLYSIDGGLARQYFPDVSGSAMTGVTVAAGWSDAWNEPVIIMGAGRGTSPRITVFGVWSEENLATWAAFANSSTYGVSVGYKADRIAAALQGLGQPVIREFSMSGERLAQTKVFEDSFRGGLSVALASNSDGIKVAAVPMKVNPKQATIGSKKILINLKKQELSLVENNVVVSVRRISSGKWSTPTPVGTFKTRNKISVAYSRPYKLYMEYWMAITPDGKYGIHSLPYWKLKNGGKLYEGAAHIGTPVSHGCIRQTVADAKSLFDWAPIGTPVIITK